MCGILISDEKKVIFIFFDETSFDIISYLLFGFVYVILVIAKIYLVLQLCIQTFVWFESNYNLIKSQLVD